MSAAPQLDLLSWSARGPYLTDDDQKRLTRQRRAVLECLSDGRERSLRQIEDETGEPQASISARWRELVDMKRWFTHKRQVRRGLYLYRIDVTRPHEEGV